MDPVLVDVALLRGLATGGLKLAPGRVIMARVVSNDGSGRGELAIAGGRLSATLPASLRAGEELRLVVQNISAGRVLLHNEPAPQPQQEPLQDADGGGGAAATPMHVLELCYDAQRLGPVDLRFELHAGALRVVVGMASAAALASATSAADELRGALAGASGLEVGVSVVARRPPLDVYV
ncbi:MAG: hypothetical protein ABSG64_09710 [Solirubrobacteraceae bacterium]|jgi:hypothetical protein